MTDQEKTNLFRYRFQKALNVLNPSEDFIKGAEWAVEWLGNFDTGYRSQYIRYNRSDTEIKISYETDIEPLNNDEL